MKTSETDLNFDSACLEILKNQTMKEILDPTPQVEITVTLSLDNCELILWNGIHSITLAPDGPTGQFILRSLLTLRRKQDEVRQLKQNSIIKKPKKKKNKEKIKVEIKQIPEAKPGIALSRYKNLGSGKGRELKPETKPKKEVKKTLSIFNL